MQLNRRLMISLLGGVAAVSLVFAAYQAATELRAMKDDVQWQAVVLAESQRIPVEQRMVDGSQPELQAFVDRLPNRGQFAGMVLEERVPRRRTGLIAPRQVLAHRRLCHVMPQQMQLGLNPWRAPGGVVACHAVDQVAGFSLHLWPANIAWT